MPPTLRLTAVTCDLLALAVFEHYRNVQLRAEKLLLLQAERAQRLALVTRRRGDLVFAQLPAQRPARNSQLFGCFCPVASGIFERLHHHLSFHVLQITGGQGDLGLLLFRRKFSEHVSRANLGARRRPLRLWQLCSEAREHCPATNGIEGRAEPLR